MLEGVLSFFNPAPRMRAVGRGESFPSSLVVRSSWERVFLK